MKPAPFRYYRPTSLQEALDVLARVGGHGKVLAGGQSLVPLLSMRLAEPEAVVDINAVPGLDTIEVRDDVVHVGALVRHTDLERDEHVFAAQPLLRRALRLVAHPTIRNRGTTMGSLAHADPAAEMPAVLTLLGGRVLARSAAPGRPVERWVRAGDFFVGPMESALRPDELAVGFEVPVAAAGEGTAIGEVARRHGDYAVCGVAVRVVLSDGLVTTADAAYVSAGECGRVYPLADGRLPLRPEALDVPALAGQARKVVSTEADIHASAQYRSQLVEVLTARAVRSALVDAGAGGDADSARAGRVA
ncbi:MAG: FAD binding domain-containing protein [Actinomycetes bacterium]